MGVCAGCLKRLKITARRGGRGGYKKIRLDTLRQRRIQRDTQGYVAHLAPNQTSMERGYEKIRPSDWAKGGSQSKVPAQGSGHKVFNLYTVVGVGHRVLSPKTRGPLRLHHYYYDDDDDDDYYYYYYEENEVCTVVITKATYAPLLPAPRCYSQPRAVTTKTYLGCIPYLGNTKLSGLLQGWALCLSLIELEWIVQEFGTWGSRFGLWGTTRS